MAPANGPQLAHLEASLLLAVRQSVQHTQTGSLSQAVFVGQQFALAHATQVESPASGGQVAPPDELLLEVDPELLEDEVELALDAALDEEALDDDELPPPVEPPVPPVAVELVVDVPPEPPPNSMPVSPQPAASAVAPRKSPRAEIPTKLGCIAYFLRGPRGGARQLVLPQGKRVRVRLSTRASQIASSP